MGGSIYFGNEAAVDARRGHDVQHGAADGGGRRVRPGEHGIQDLGFGLALIEAVAHEAPQHILVSLHLLRVRAEARADDFLRDAQELAAAGGVRRLAADEVHEAAFEEDLPEDGRGGAEGYERQFLVHGADEGVEVLVLGEVAKGLAEGDTGDDVQGPVLGCGGEVNGAVGGGG